MSTRGRIGIELPDHSVLSVYCHFDNYPEGTGRILVKHYLNRNDVKDLIDGGNMSSLRTRKLWDSKILKDSKGDFIFDENGEMMYENDRNPQPLYYSERGEELNVSHTSFDEFISSSAGEDYAYLFDLNDNWKCYKLNYGTPAERVNIPNYVTA